MTTSQSLIDDQWEILRSFLPPDLDEHARSHDAMRRKRGSITNAEQLLRLLLMHIAGGLSLEQTVARAELRGLAKLNAMALHKRLCSSGPWLAALTTHLLAGITATLQASSFESLADRTVRILDATTISEPGSTGTDWRLHYSLRLPEMKCDFFELTDAKGGESVRRPPIHEGDIFLLDRGYNDRKAIAGVLRTKADVVLRWHSQAFPLMDGQGRAFPLLSKIRKLRIGEIGEYAAWFKHGTESLPMRVCVLRKSNEAALRSERKARHKARSSKTVRPQTIELTQYLVVLTSLPAAVITSRVVLECYRARWQVALAFKRLKSLLELGQLPKKKAASSLAWMQGKIFCALMIERILCEARSLSPWGYRLR